MSESSAVAMPVNPWERIAALDVLRGFALLGILIINIQSFAMPQAAYLNPTSYGHLTGVNQWVWILSHVFVDQKFMNLFSAMFGVGIVLMSGRIEARGRGSAALHYRRTVGLIIIGLMHAYLIWHGDVLVAFGVCALVVFLFRKISARWLLVLGLVSVAVPSLIFFFSGWSMPYWPEESYEGLLSDWKPTADVITREIAAYQGGWLEQMGHRVRFAVLSQTFLFVLWVCWRAGGLMLIGIALFKWGVVTAQRSRKCYLTLMGVGFGIGLPVVAYGVIRNFQEGWSLDYSMFYGSQFNYWGSLLVSLGYIGAVMIVCKSDRQRRLTQPLAAVGRMALSNYLLQSVVCTFIFYGDGLGLFGQLERITQIGVVVLVWIFQLFASVIWLRYFRFGPVEWLWRSLTYLRFPPMRPPAVLQYVQPAVGKLGVGKQSITENSSTGK